MKIRVSFLPLLLSVIFLAVAHSRAGGLIGQSYEKCEAQLGKPTKHVETGRQIVSDLWTFVQGDWSIEIGVWKGVVQMVSYERVDGKPLEVPEIQALLAGFGDKMTWNVDSTGRFRRSDRLMEAKATDRGLTFLTTELAHAL